MRGLDEVAMEWLFSIGLTSDQWGAIHGWSERDGEWFGDSCGCIDDRCIGHHHFDAYDCGCRWALLEDFLRAVDD